MDKQNRELMIITAGSTYLDIDAYACAVAMAELLNQQGVNAIAYSQAPCNYSVCECLVEGDQIMHELPPGVSVETSEYIIVDVSDPDFLKSSVPLDRVRAVYDHHAGFEEYWKRKIGEGSHIEFIGAAATLIYREWERASLTREMKISTAKLLIAAILDNTLNLTSSNTTEEDRNVFRALCAYAKVGDGFLTWYFSEVQKSIEADLKNALFGDIKSVRDNSVLPQRVSQLTVWDAMSVLARLPEIRAWFALSAESWMINIIDINHQCSYFVCDAEYNQKEIERIFDVCFEAGVAKSAVSYLRKQIIKKTL